MQVFEYTEKNLAIALSNKYTPPEIIVKKNHFIYLKDYLGSDEINACTIVIEDNYVSKDYLHDYASYYALCFEEYPKLCKRVHFFSNKFEENDFNTILLGDKNLTAEFWKNYIGFIVVKPIPVTIIGYSVLKTYTNHGGFNNRYYWGLRKYKVHLFGNEIEIDSLAFQEQDSVLAACATTAIWVMLNKAALDFHTILKSPSQITKDADEKSPDGSRLFPNKGLNILQICQAILNSGLVSEVKQPDLIRNLNGSDLYVISNLYLKKILNAYSPIGIPIILVINVPNGNSYGLHAITISGFKLIAPADKPPSNEISWLATNIEKFYAHDDQWGPFARIEFSNDSEIETPWTKILAPGHPTFTTNIIVPIYPKIRISYEDIEALVHGLDTILTIFFDQQIISDLIWDIKIDYSENYKKNVKESSVDNNVKISILKKSLPKYLWIATCYIGEHKILQFTFDATDVRSGMIGEDIISFLPEELHNELKSHLKLNRNFYESLFMHIASTAYYQFVIEKLT